MQSTHPSIIQRALIWCAATMAGFLLLTAVGVFLDGYEMAAKNQDRLLREVVGIVSRDVVRERYEKQFRQFAGGGFYGPGSRLGSSIEDARAALTMDDDLFVDTFELDEDHTNAKIEPGDMVYVRLLDQRGVAVPLTFSQAYEDGAHTMTIDDRDYRVFLLTLKDGTHVGAGQSIAERNEQILHSALLAAAPILILAPCMLFVLMLVLRRALRPVRYFAQELDRKNEMHISQVDSAGMPKELMPAINSMNALMGRVEELRQRESRFVADAAHELRSPLTALRVQVEGLAAMQLSADVQTRVHTLLKSIDRTTNLVSQLLAYKRAQVQTRQNTSNRVACQPVIAEVLEELFPVSDQKNIRLEVEGFDAPGVEDACVALNESDLVSLIRNPLHNAVHYTPIGGVVTLQIKLRENAVELIVLDTGSGIPPEDRQRVWDPFYRIAGSGKPGTGLGLAICKAIADRTNVQLSLDWANPEKETGLAFSICLPRC